MTEEKGPYAPEIVGPFDEYRVTVDGYRVPYLNARELPDGRVAPTVDGRFGLSEAVPREEFDRWLPLLANAMAVAAGYSCHGENCAPLNPFKMKMMRLGTKPNLTLIDGGDNNQH